MSFRQGLQLRIRLLRLSVHRQWKILCISKVKKWIAEIHCQSENIFESPTPAIILSSYNEPKDFLILSYLFKNKDLTFLTPPILPDGKIFTTLKSINHSLIIGERGADRSFFKKLFTILRDFNRSIVISLDAAKKYTPNLQIDPAIIAKISIKTNVPVIPIFLAHRDSSGHMKYGKKKYHIFVDKKVYISPKTEEFKDVFFKRRGARKFERLSREDLNEIGTRIFARLETLRKTYGSNLSKEVESKLC